MSEENSSNPKSRDLNEEERDLKGVLDEVISVAGDSTPNAPASSPAEDAQKTIRDEALFKSIEKKKKQKKRRIIRNVIIVLVIVGLAGFKGVTYLRRRVQVRSVSGLADVSTYEAGIGSISTTVSGSGTLANVDEEYVRVPEGVEIEKVVVDVNDILTKGDVIAELDMSTVRSCIAATQSEIEELDGKIYSAAADTIDKNLTAGLKGRVKAIYAKKGDYVSDCMYDNGALAILSLDGYMAVKINAPGLVVNEEVTVTRGNGSDKTVKGTVESVVNGIAVVLVKDDGPEIGEKVTVSDSEGKNLGSGELYVHKPMRVTGIAGKIAYVNISLNHYVNKGDVMFGLTETTYSASYESLVKERGEKEELLLELMQINRNGALLAPFDGSVGAVLYEDEKSSASSSSASASSAAASSQFTGMGGSAFTMMSAYSAASASAAASASDSASAAESTASEEGKIDVIRLSPDELMEVSISVDESHILALEVGQTAALSVSSIGDDTFSGILTAIDKTANSSSGVTRYSATVSVKKDPRMLPGMTAKVVVRIEGVDGAIIIPVEALHQTSSTSFVYTSYDAEVGEYGGIVEVEAGISNSSYVEITDGLKEGDVVYYVESSKDAFGFGMGGMNGGMGGGMNGGPGGPGGGRSGGRP